MLLQLGSRVVCHLLGWWTDAFSLVAPLSAVPSQFREGGIISLHLHFGRSQPQRFGAAFQKLMEVLCIYDVGAWGGIWPLAFSAEVAKVVWLGFIMNAGGSLSLLTGSKSIKASSFQCTVSVLEWTDLVSLKLNFVLNHELQLKLAKF